MNTKVCTKCGETKPATTEYFYRKPSAKCGLQPSCKCCAAQDQRDYVSKNKSAVAAGRRAWYLRNKTKVAEQSARWARDNRESRRASVRRWGAKNKEKKRAYYIKNKARMDEQSARWRNENRGAMRKSWREWSTRNKAKRNAQYAVRHKTDPAFRIFNAVRDRLSRCLNKYKNPDRLPSTNQLGCSASELREHFETNFLPGMSWNNYGQYTVERRTWTADHCVPLRGRVGGELVFNPLDREEVAVAASKFNLFPMWGLDNIMKRNRVPHWDEIPPELQAICTPRIRALLQKVKKTA